MYHFHHFFQNKKIFFFNFFGRFAHLRTPYISYSKAGSCNTGISFIKDEHTHTYMIHLYSTGYTFKQ